MRSIDGQMAASCCAHPDARCLDRGVKCSECDDEGYPRTARRRLTNVDASGIVVDVDDGTQFRPFSSLSARVTSSPTITLPSDGVKKRKTGDIVWPQISSFGRYRNRRNVVSTPRPERSGYARIGICKNLYFVHRLMAIAFKLPRKPGQNVVNHKDILHKTNRIDLLEWATQGENIRHSRATNANRKSCARRKCKPIRGRKVGTTEWTVYSGGANAAGRALGIAQGTISSCCNKGRGTAGGHEFEFAAPTEPEALEGEEWRDTIGGKARVSSFGRFRSGRNGIVHTPAPREDGYVTVGVNRKKYLMHVLVATAFDLPRRPDQTTVDHEDNNPSNNRVANLRWLSPSEQIRHSYATNAERGTGARRRCKPVRGRKVGTTEWTTYSGGVSDAARRLGLHQGAISLCCNPQRKQKATKGYEFQFADPTEPDTLEGEEWRDVDFLCTECSRAL